MQDARKVFDQPVKVLDLRATICFRLINNQPILKDSRDGAI